MPVKVLLVDNDALISEQLGAALQSGGHDVRIARDGLEGLQLTRDFRPDVILLDARLPKIDAPRFCRYVR